MVDPESQGSRVPPFLPPCPSFGPPSMVLPLRGLGNIGVGVETLNRRGDDGEDQSI